MSRPCTCDRDGCTPCWLYAHSPRHRAAMGGDPRDARPAGHMTRIGVPPAPPRPAPAAARPPCRHLGGEVRRQECPSCRGTVQLLIYACRVFTECTLATRAAGVPGCCAGCPAYEPRA